MSKITRDIAALFRCGAAFRTEQLAPFGLKAFHTSYLLRIGANPGISQDTLPLAYAYVPWQKWRLLYTPENALASGTLFEELNKPLGVYGNE